MGNLLNIGARALVVNQDALTVIGNNIVNANTPGYSRQSVELASVAGQYTGSGYFGKGVEITTVERAYSDFLTRQAGMFKSIAAADTARFDNLTQLEEVFQGGPNGLGANMNDMLNAFSDIVNSPTDLTARTVALTRADEMAGRFRQMAQQITDLKTAVSQRLDNQVSTINDLAQQVAKLNSQISLETGSGHTPNDLLDQRDQLISKLNQYIQTIQVKADDGSLNIFVGGSQALVLGSEAASLSVGRGSSEYGTDDSQRALYINHSGQMLAIADATLGGGEIAGLLRFHNSDLADASSMLGRLALTIATRVNEQQALGIDMNGNLGQAMFMLEPIPDGLAPQDSSGNPTNTGNATLTVSVQGNPSDTGAFTASNYEVTFTSPTAGTIRRLADGQVQNFNFAATDPVLIDGLALRIGAGTAAIGDRFLLKPFSAAAASINTTFTSPRNVAVANPLAAKVTTSTGTLSYDSLAMRAGSGALPPLPATLTYDANTQQFSYTDPNTSTTVSVPYSPGSPMLLDIAGWRYELTFKGTPGHGDTIEVGRNQHFQIDAGNAKTMLDLRDEKLIDGGPLADGYAGLIANIGIRAQGAKSAQAMSNSTATSLEKSRAGVSGVNLDEEAARLLQYQQAYQAVGKMMQIAQNVFDTLMQSLGR